MKNKLFGTLSLLMGFMLLFSLVACGGGDDGNGGGGTVTYTGKAGDGTTYTLTITENTSRAAYEPEEEDEYVFVTSSGKTSRGKVIYVTPSGTTITLEPGNSDDSFTVTVNGNSITYLNGTVTWSDGSINVYTQAPLSPENPGNGGDEGMGWPPQAVREGCGLGGLNKPGGVSQIFYRFWVPGEEGEEYHNGFINFEGNINTKNTILSFFDNGWELRRTDTEASSTTYVYRRYISGDLYYGAQFKWWPDSAGRIEASVYQDWD